MPHFIRKTGCNINTHKWEKQSGYNKILTYKQSVNNIFAQWEYKIKYWKVKITFMHFTIHYLNRDI